MYVTLLSHCAQLALSCVPLLYSNILLKYYFSATITRRPEVGVDELATLDRYHHFHGHSGLPVCLISLSL